MATQVQYNMKPQVHQLRFPLSAPPRCLACNHTTERRQVSPKSRYGNAGRWYYVCTVCKKRAPKEDNMQVGWSTWDDERGVDASNPPCECIQIQPSRLDLTQDRKLFRTCATGSCRYYFWIGGGLKEDRTADVFARGWIYELPTTCEGQLGGGRVMGSKREHGGKDSRASCWSTLLRWFRSGLVWKRSFASKSVRVKT
jgi:hypothetical protein